MQINPRQQLLDVWSSIVNHCVADGKWNWGPRGGRSSVEDAERLLCLMYPATEIPAFQLSDPDLLQHDVHAVLKSVGSRLDIPEAFRELLAEHVRAHTSDDGQPAFRGGSYFVSGEAGREPSAAQRELGTVDSYSLSITLCLATLGFLKVMTDRLPPGPARRRADDIRRSTETRLTAAMVNLLRSYTVDVFDAESEQGRGLCGLLGRDTTSDRVVLQHFQRRFGTLRATLEDQLLLGIDVPGRLARGDQMFACGWAWGVVRDAPPVETSEDIGPQPDGCADAVPSPHFTVVAIDGIVDLFSERTRILGLLTGEQRRLAEALRLRWDVTQQYWSGIARFDGQPWPLEDIPWRTTDDRTAAEYYTLSVASILAHEFVQRPTADEDLLRIARVMERLAERGRVTSRPTDDDPALRLHAPGIGLPLPGSELLGPPLRWTVNDFSAQLLKRTIQLASVARTTKVRDRLQLLAEQTMEHLWRRRRRYGDGAGLWDDLGGVHPGAPAPSAEPSWGVTERVVEAMVAASLLLAQPPLRSPDLTARARDLISEATHLLGVELQGPSPPAEGAQGLGLRGIVVRLQRARALVDERPGTATALAMRVLEDLDELTRARRTAREGG